MGNVSNYPSAPLLITLLRTFLPKWYSNYSEIFWKNDWRIWITYQDPPKFPKKLFYSFEYHIKYCDSTFWIWAASTVIPMKDYRMFLENVYDLNPLISVILVIKLFLSIYFLVVAAIVISQDSSKILRTWKFPHRTGPMKFLKMFLIRENLNIGHFLRWNLLF